MESILKALTLLHEFKIIHRDLKPSNILINNNNKFKLADFGFAKYEYEIEQEQFHVGTPLYMAPEAT